MPRMIYFSHSVFIYVSQDDRKKQYCFTKSINPSPFNGTVVFSLSY